MAYRIEYGENSARYDTVQRIPFSFLSRLMICVLCFLLMTVWFWPDGREVMLDALLPGDAEITKQALSHMAHNLRHGEDIGDTVTVFCREIIDGAKLSD